MGFADDWIKDFSDPDKNRKAARAMLARMCAESGVGKHGVVADMVVVEVAVYVDDPRDDHGRPTVAMEHGHDFHRIVAEVAREMRIGHPCDIPALRFVEVPTKNPAIVGRQVNVLVRTFHPDPRASG